MLVMTLVVRDEADILDAQLAFHLNAGVDFVIATDHRSRDGTTEILGSYERAGVLRLFREDGEFSRQGEWQTRMARLAALEHGADWVIPSDADEFWWPRGRSLSDVLSAVPERFGIVRALTRNFVPLRDEPGSLGESLTLRFAAAAPISDPATPFRPVVKVAHRAHPDVVASAQGSHQVFGLPWAVLRGWHPLECLHAPLRSREQCARKYRKTWTGWEDNLRGDLARARLTTEQGRQDALWERVALANDAVERGLAEGSLVRDTRLRDVLDTPVSAATTVARRVPDSGTPDVPLPSGDELLAYALDVAVFDEAELVRTQRRVDGIVARLRALERNT
jgi:hypothetical protein